MHEDWDHSTIVSRNTAVVAEKHPAVTRKWRQVDPVVYKCPTTVNTACHRELRGRAGCVPPVIKDCVHRSVSRIDGQPGKELDLSIFQRIVIDPHWLRPRRTTIT